MRNKNNKGFKIIPTEKISNKLWKSLTGESCFCWGDGRAGPGHRL